MRVAIVTGAGSGIGRATALKLASLKYAIALVGRTRSTLEAVDAEAKAAGSSKTLVIPADVAKVAEVNAMIERVAAECSRIDVLINNAGHAPLVPTHQATPEQWDQILNTNLSSAFYAIRAAWPIMQNQSPKGGVIINISSMAAKDPFPNLGAYGVAKAGLNILTLATAREGAPHNIRVIGIAPGAVDTPMFRGLFGNQIDDVHILQPDNIADAILAAIDGGLAYSSGDTIYVHRSPA
jgi:NAD(P)-dependent dehydrogenase (short-subunit alcohol dehydrogenase family)